MNTVNLNEETYPDTDRNYASELSDILDIDNHDLDNHIGSGDFIGSDKTGRIEGIAKLKLNNDQDILGVCIRQSRKLSADTTSFGKTTLSCILFSNVLGIIEYKKTKKSKDQGRLMDRDMKIADPYISIVDKMIDELYKDIFTRNSDAFSKAE